MPAELDHVKFQARSTGAPTDKEPLTSAYREFAASSADEFVARGYMQREFFPHRVYYLPKCGPDGLKLAQRMCGDVRLDDLWELVLYATSPVIDRFPEKLFFDNDLIWHQQQFGKAGQVATANLRLRSKTLHTMVHLSDLVQRAARRPEYRTQIQNRFRGWHRMLLNAVLNFALERDVATIFSPTSELALENTDPARAVQRELFERVYDRALLQRFKTVRDGRWWRLDVQANRDRVVVGRRRDEEIGSQKSICIVHYTERGLGHLDVDAQFARLADERSPQHLEEMLAMENDAGVRSTYCVVGCMLNEVRERIEAGGHSIAFHSYDHDMEENQQLQRCRDIDYRIKGYSPPRSKLTAELTPEKLCYHNFEWFAISRYALDELEIPALQQRIAVIPIRFDDFALHDKGLPYEQWEAGAVNIMETSRFVAFGLHDCYGGKWLPSYPRLLQTMQRLGQVRTLDEVSAQLFLAAAD